MSYLDDKVKELGLYEYLPELTKKDDFDSFWADTLNNKIPLNLCKVLLDYPIKNVDVYEVTYNGFDKTPIYGWFIQPKFESKYKKTCLICYHGFSGNRGIPSNYMSWAMMGVSVLAIDCRSQSGLTGNYMAETSSSYNHIMTKGILDKEEYYLRALYVDCIRAIDVAEKFGCDDIAVTGGSQGGGLGVAVCALDKRPRLCIVDVPSNSNLVMRVEMSAGMFNAVGEYLKKFPYNTDKAFETLSYFDTMNMADKITAKVYASVGLRDNTCPAKLFFATYNRINTEKSIEIYPFNGHEGGGQWQQEKKIKFLADNLK